MTNVITNGKFWGNITTSLLLIGIWLDMAYPSDIFSDESNSRLIPYMNRALITCIMTGFLLFNYKLPQLQCIRNFEISLFLFLGFMLFNTVYYVVSISTIFELSKIIYWIIGFLFFRQVSNQGFEINVKSVILFSFALIVFAAFSYTQTSGTREIIRLESGFEKISSNYGYILLNIVVLLFSLPTFLKSMWVIGLLLIFAVISLKRGVIICVGAMSVFHYFALKRLGFKRKVRNKLINFIMFVLFMIAYGGLIFSRFLYLKTEGGSGRTLIYSSIINGFNESDTFEYLFGHGFLSTLNHVFSTVGYAAYAHSDWLQILYDFGLIGVLLYLYIFTSIWQILISCWKNRSYEILSWGSFGIIFTISGIISGGFLSPHMIYYMLPLGYLANNLETKVQRI